jgi:hypothetical protein
MDDGRPIGILVDIQGPKHRVGLLPNPNTGTEVFLRKGQTYIFDSNTDLDGDEERVVSSFDFLNTPSCRHASKFVWRRAEAFVSRRTFIASYDYKTKAYANVFITASTASSLCP